MEGTSFISHYRILDPLGTGGMGEKFTAARANVKVGVPLVGQS